MVSPTICTNKPDLNTAIFQNRDGAKTLHQYGSPVKYIADYGYVNSENDIYC